MRTSFKEKTLNIINTLVLIVISLIMLYPFYYIVIYSLSDPMLVYRESVFLLPKGFTLINYKEIFTKNDIFGPFLISSSRAIIGAALNVIGCSMFAYALTKKELPFRKFMYRAVVITMYISAGLIPYYVLISKLNLRNNYLVYIIPHIIVAYYLILVKTYIEQLPAELEECAMVEGAGYFKRFWLIIMPIIKPVLAVVAIFGAVGQWNLWVDNLYFCTKSELMTLQLMLLKFMQSQQFSLRDAAMLASMDQQQIQVTPQSIQMTITVVVILPIMLVYPFMQRYFIKGIMIGAIKG